MPNLNQVHVSRPLTNLAIGTSVKGLIAPELVPALMVPNSNGQYYVFDSEKRAFAADNDLRPPGAEAKTIDYNVTTESFTTSGHALAGYVPVETEADADNPPVAPRNGLTKTLISKVLVAQEIACKTALDAAITQTDTPTKNWDDYTDGDPFGDIETAISAIEDATGYTPNTIAMDSKVWRGVRNHPDLIARVVAGGNNATPAELSRQAFASLFDFDKVIVGNPQKNVAVKGQTADLDRIWAGDVYITYQPQTPMIDEPAFAYQFDWDAFSGDGENMGWMVQTDYDKKKHSWWVEVSKHYVYKVTMANAGYRIISVTAAADAA